MLWQLDILYDDVISLLVDDGILKWIDDFGSSLLIIEQFDLTNCNLLFGGESSRLFYLNVDAAVKQRSAHEFSGFRKSSLRQWSFTGFTPSNFSAAFQTTSGGTSGIRSTDEEQFNTVQFMNTEENIIAVS